MSARKQPMPELTKSVYRTAGEYRTVEQGVNECVIVSADNRDCNIYISFPADNSIRIRTEYDGFFIPSENKSIIYKSAKDGLTMSGHGGDVAAVLSSQPGGWKLIIRNAATGVGLQIKSEDICFGYSGSHLKRMKFGYNVGASEVLYGLGERFNAFNQRGNTIPLWNIDCVYHAFPETGDKSQAYKNIPLLHSSNGYSVFYNTYYACTADICAATQNTVTFDSYGPEFDVYIWTDGIKQNISNYTLLTGRPVRAPKWAFGYWAGNGATVWRAHGSSPEAVLDNFRSVMEKYEELGIHKLSAVYGEGTPSYLKEAYEICKKTGTRMLMWYPPAWFENKHPQLLSDIDSKDYPKVKTNETVCFDHIDYTNPNAGELIKQQYEKYWDMGLKGSMIDYGEYIIEKSGFYNGLDGTQMHNYYTYFYNKAVYDQWKARMGDDHILFSRTACAGSQKFLANFSGDQASQFYGLKQCIYGILSLSTCGFSLWGSDIGGYFGKPEPEVYIRWLQFGAFSPLMRAHGVLMERNPWAFGDTAVKVFKKLYRTRENLINTIYGSAVRAHCTGEPMVQPMAVAFPDEKVTLENSGQYVFCQNLLVSPVTQRGVTQQEVYLPAGDWCDLWTGESYTGGRYITADAPIEKIPVFIAGGAVLDITLSENFALFESAEENPVDAKLITFTKTSNSTTYYLPDGSMVNYTVEFENGHLNIYGNIDTAAVLLYGMRASGASADGCDSTLESTEAGTVIRLTGKCGAITVELIP